MLISDIMMIYTVVNGNYIEYSDISGVGDYIICPKG
jgi:hypothetical protein